VAVSKVPHELEQAEVEGLGLARVGQRVRHPKFGRGVIEGLYIFEDGTMTVRVNFGGVHGSKALLPAYAKLKPQNTWWPW
jgi:hypothetical protein